MTFNFSIYTGLIFSLTVSALDLALTFWNVSSYIKLKPKKDFTKTELNPILRLLWKIYGFKKGSIIGFFLTLFLVFNFYFGFGKLIGFHEVVYIFMGAYSVVFSLHWNFHKSLAKKTMARQRKKIKNIGRIT